MTRTAAAVVRVLLAGAAPSPAGAPESFTVDVSASRVEIHLGRAGLLKALGHDHEIEAPIAEGPGTVYEYFDHLAVEDAEAEAEQDRQKESEEDDAPSRQKRKTLRREKAEKRSLISAALKPIQTKLRQLEERIDEMENRKTELELLLADPDFFKDKSKSVPLLNEYGELRKKLDELMGRWEYQQEQLETAKREWGVSDQ